jgi:hypothetical protein
VWAVLLRAGWWGVPVTLAGIVLMVLGLSAGLGLSLIGAVAALVGMRMMAELAKRAFSARRAQAAHDPKA